MKTNLSPLNLPFLTRNRLAGQANVIKLTETSFPGSFDQFTMSGKTKLAQHAGRKMLMLKTHLLISKTVGYVLLLLQTTFYSWFI